MYPRPHPNPRHPQPLIKILIRLHQPTLHHQRSTARLPIVLLHGQRRIPECHDSVTHELVDGAAGGFDAADDDGVEELEDADGVFGGLFGYHGIKAVNAGEKDLKGGEVRESGEKKGQKTV